MSENPLEIRKINNFFVSIKVNQILDYLLLLLLDELTRPELF